MIVHPTFVMCLQSKLKAFTLQSHCSEDLMPFSHQNCLEEWLGSWFHFWLQDQGGLGVDAKPLFWNSFNGSDFLLLSEVGRERPVVWKLPAMSSGGYGAWVCLPEENTEKMKNMCIKLWEGHWLTQDVLLTFCPLSFWAQGYFPWCISIFVFSGRKCGRV